MLPKEQRLTRDQFTHILKKGVKYSGNMLYARVAPLPQEHQSQHTRCSFVISKKIAKTAVARHKIRRWGYEGVQKYNNHVKKGYGIIFHITQPYSDISYQTLEQDIFKTLSKMNLIENKS